MYRVDIKDERPTSNIERPTSNVDIASLCYLYKKQTPNLNGYFFFFSAVFMLATNILMSSSVSPKISLSCLGSLRSGIF